MTEAFMMVFVLAFSLACTTGGIALIYIFIREWKKIG